MKKEKAAYLLTGTPPFNGNRGKLKIRKSINRAAQLYAFMFLILSLFYAIIKGSVLNRKIRNKAEFREKFIQAYTDEWRDLYVV